ncbi:carbonic anhydrase [Chryseolinea serpens]|uniref:Carbonic anhydrase n=1 Tax=Chryseolinea serpens TaxID=947013 RepID=A0A1M5VG00_9BACT|nr:carbonic anhydrase family protein [Chryseolinea serpens]SHH74150.1 carbonic anhydrase [Chryseolinea serpens]
MTIDKKVLAYIVVGMLTAILSCSKSPCEGGKDNLIVETVLTADEQSRLTPAQVIQSLREGNVRFCANDLTARDHSKQIREAARSQFPKAVIVSCLDSRIPVEDIFDKGIGDIFVARVAGNVINEDILGSLEYGCAVAGAKVVVVLGHENCGAIKAGIDNVRTGNITSLVVKIRRAVDQAAAAEINPAPKSKDFIHAVCLANVQISLTDIHDNSPILKTLEEQGKISIVGALYDINTGQVKFLDRDQ